MLVSGGGVDIEERDECLDESTKEPPKSESASREKAHLPTLSRRHVSVWESNTTPKRTRLKSPNFPLSKPRSLPKDPLEERMACYTRTLKAALHRALGLLHECYTSVLPSAEAETFHEENARASTDCRGYLAGTLPVVRYRIPQFKFLMNLILQFQISGNFRKLRINSE